MKADMIQAHLDVAERYAKLSKARRLNVGAVVVKDDRIISIGYNGTPPGWDNNCEYEIPLPQQEISPSQSEQALRDAVAYVGGMTDRFACRQGAALLGWEQSRLPQGIDTH